MKQDFIHIKLIFLEKPFFGPHLFTKHAILIAGSSDLFILTVFFYFLTDWSWSFCTLWFAT